MNSSPDLDTKLTNLRDLGDLCLQWPELRPGIEAIRQRYAEDDPQLAASLGWLMVLADRTFTSEEFTWYRAEDDSGGV